MPKKPKSGPPYTDIPDEVYVVVTHPWGMDRNSRMRGQVDFDRIASWAQLVLQQGGLGGGRIATIECIYGMGTRDEIIIQFEEGTDVIPLLGEHRWANIVKDWDGPPNDPRSTCVFLYNWRNNGDPANHSWTENFPRCLPLRDVPAKFPYPAPSWTAPPNSLTNFVLSIPRPPIPPPVTDRVDAPDQGHELTTPLPPLKPAAPEQEDQPDSTVEQDSESTGHYRPYDPPPQHRSHARFLDKQQGESNKASSCCASSPPPKFIKKLDPYELEEDAFNILRAPSPIQEDVKNVKKEEPRPDLYLSVKAEHHEIKLEDGGVQEDVASRPGLPSRNLPPASLGYQPSAELEAYINAHLQSTAVTASSSSSPASGSGSRPTPSTRVTVKREYGEDTTPLGLSSQPVPPASIGYQPSAKLEAYINVHLQSVAATTSSSSGSGSGARPPATARVTVKREYEDDMATSLGESKRIKIEQV